MSLEVCYETPLADEGVITSTQGNEMRNVTMLDNNLPVSTTSRTQRGSSFDLMGSMINRSNTNTINQSNDGWLKVLTGNNVSCKDYIKR